MLVLICREKLENARRALLRDHSYRESIARKKLLLQDLKKLHPPAQWNSLTGLPLIMGLFHSAGGPYGAYFSSEEW